MTGPVVIGTLTGWHRLHPLSPLVRSGRTAVGLLALIGITAAAGLGQDGSHLYDGLAAALVAAGAVINWLVTRWRLDGATLCIETGLLRRDSRQLPVARIQAVDVVRPFWPASRRSGQVRSDRPRTQSRPSSTSLAASSHASRRTGGNQRH